jgi:hypothetical protein
MAVNLGQKSQSSRRPEGSALGVRRPGSRRSDDVSYPWILAFARMTKVVFLDNNFAKVSAI